MAGDWIKMRRSLLTSPKVAVIARMTKLDPYAVCGRLLALWSWADEHTDDGVALGIDGDYIDQVVVSKKGFCDALSHPHVGWMEITNEGISLPSYEEHNGATAKRRAKEAQRKGASRKKAPKRPQSVRDVSASDADRVRNREEKRREEKKPPPPPSPSTAAAAAVLSQAGITKAKADALAQHHSEAEARMALAIWREDTKGDRARLGLVVSMLEDGTAMQRLSDWSAARLNALAKSDQPRLQALLDGYREATGAEPPKPGEDGCGLLYEYTYLQLKPET